VSFVSIVSVGQLEALFFTTFQQDSINAFETFDGPPTVRRIHFTSRATSLAEPPSPAER
jgi:hypothetical protein